MSEKNSDFEITVDYEGGSASATYKGKNHEFSLYEDDSHDYGDRYIEIQDESGKDSFTIDYAYNRHAVGEDNSYMLEVEKIIAKSIEEYLSTNA